MLLLLLLLLLPLLDFCFSSWPNAREKRREERRESRASLWTVATSWQQQRSSHDHYEHDATDDDHHHHVRPFRLACFDRPSLFSLLWRNNNNNHNNRPETRLGEEKRKSWSLHLVRYRKVKAFSVQCKSQYSSLSSRRTHNDDAYMQPELIHLPVRWLFMISDRLLTDQLKLAPYLPSYANHDDDHFKRATIIGR